jgi:hypothetical protein
MGFNINGRMFRIGMTVNKKTEKINNEIKEQAAFSFNVVGGTGKVTNFTPVTMVPFNLLLC